MTTAAFVELRLNAGQRRDRRLSTATAPPWRHGVASFRHNAGGWTPCHPSSVPTAARGKGSALHSLPRPNVIFSSSRSPVATAAVLLVAFLLGRISKRHNSRRLVSIPGNSTLPIVSPGTIESITDELLDEGGSTPQWLNFAFSRMWALFQKNTKRVMEDTIQPIIDKQKDKPDFVKRVRLTKFIPGRQSPLIQSVQRLPSRALNQVQYSARCIFSSTSVTDFLVDCEILGFKFTVPVTLENLDADGNLWLSNTLAPYEPFLTSVQYALMEPPTVSFDMTIARVIPITAVPVLRRFFFRLIAQEIPKEFTLPQTIKLDFTPEEILTSKASIEVNLKDTSMTPEMIARMSQSELVDLFPEQWALFDALDLDSNGSLSSVEIFAGLRDWGYTAQDAVDSFSAMDENGDKSISFDEFCIMWPSFAASFVPSRYQGELKVFLRKATGMRTSGIFGLVCDPAVSIRLSEQETCSKRDSQTSIDGELGSPVWMQSFDFNCVNPKNETLDIEVTDRSRFSLSQRQMGKATIPLSTLTQRQNQQLKVNLAPQGSIWLDLSYAEFI